MFIDYSKDFKSFLRTSFFVFLSIFPFILYKGFLFNATSSRSLNMILFTQILLICVGAYLFRNRAEVKFIKSPITIIFLILLAATSLASILGVDFATSFWSKVTRTTGLLYFFHAGFLFLLFSSVFNNKKDILNFLKIFVVSTALFSLLSALGNEGFGIFFQNKEWQGLTFGNSTFAGTYLFSAFIVSLYFVFSRTEIFTTWFRYLLPFILIFNPFIFNFSLLRGGSFNGLGSVLGSAQASAITILLSFIGFVALFLIQKIQSDNIRKKISVALVSLSVAVVALVSISLLAPGGFVQKKYLENSSSARPLVWELSKKAIKEKPLLGWGVDNFDIAYQNYYDNRVLEIKNGGEAWFDRSHNVFIDQTIETGYLGLLAYILAFLVVIYCLTFVLVKTKDKDYRLLSLALIIYFIGHVLEVQTSFDTTISYFPFLFLASIAAFLFYETKDGKVHGFVLNKNLIAVVGVAFSLIMFFYGTINIIKSQAANTAVRVVGSSAKRIEVYPQLFATKMDKPAFLWATSNDIQRGVSFNTSVLEDQFQRDGLREEISVILKYYENYLLEDSNNARALLNMADFYIYQRLLEVDNLKRAHEIADKVIEINPSMPQSYWLKAVAYLYQAKFDQAGVYAKKAYDLNPGIEESTRLKEYIDRSIQEFPNIVLYSFRQI